jgi:hypothetical protein
MMLLAVDLLGPECSARTGLWQTVEPVSPPPKRKLEKSEQRPAPETRVQRTEMPEVAPRRPGLTSLTRGNVDAFPFWGKYYAETELCG